MQSVRNGMTWGLQTLYSGYQSARERSVVVDSICSATLKTIHDVAFKLFNVHIFTPSSYETTRGRRFAREAGEYHNKETIKTCQLLGTFSEKFVVKTASEGAQQIPKYAEAYGINRAFWPFFWLYWPFRYTYSQLNRRFRAQVLESETAKWGQSSYVSLSTKVIHFFGKPILHTLHLELLFLDIVKKLERPRGKAAFNVKKALFKRVAKSLHNEKELSKIWSGAGMESEKWIKALSWLKREGDLPGGLPDPDDGLLPGNIQQKEQEALEKYAKDVLVKFLDKHAPLMMHNTAVWVFYELEGKEAFVSVVSKLLIEIFVTQVADPDRFAQSILFGGGSEVMDLELDGFGPYREGDVFETGQRILKSFQTREPLGKILKESELKTHPGGEIALKQKEETKARLQAFFVKFIRQGMNLSQQSGSEKKRATLYGGGSAFSQVLMQTMQIGMSKLKLASDYSAKFAQEQMENFLASRMVDLIYHPSWKIILLQIFEDLTKRWEQEEVEQPQEISKEEFKGVCDFFASHFFGSFEMGKLPSFTTFQTFNSALNSDWNPIQWFKSEKSFGEAIASRILDQYAEDWQKSFQEYAETPPEKPFVTSGLEAIGPSIQEQLLWCRLVQAMRMKGKPFEGDDKFWEVFLRYAIVHLQKKEGVSRDQVVEELLGRSDPELLDYLENLEIPKVVEINESFFN